jgi:hypothetical protein
MCDRVVVSMTISHGSHTAFDKRGFDDHTRHAHAFDITKSHIFKSRFDRKRDSERADILGLIQQMSVSLVLDR